MISFQEMYNRAETLKPALLVDRFVPFTHRRVLRKILMYLSIALFIITIGTLTKEPQTLIYMIRGALFVVFTLWIMSEMLEMMYWSFYFRDRGIDFELAYMVLFGKSDDLIHNFLKAPFGKKVCERLEIPEQAVLVYADKRGEQSDAFDISFQHNPMRSVGIETFGVGIYDTNVSFQEFLKRHNVDRDLFIQALRFEDTHQHMMRNHGRWWDKEHLISIPSIGQKWSLGQYPLLETHAIPLAQDVDYLSHGDTWKVLAREIVEIEIALQYNDFHNGMIVAPTEHQAKVSAVAFGQSMMRGLTEEMFEGKRVFVFDTKEIIQKKGIEKTVSYIASLSKELTKARDVFIIWQGFAESFELLEESGVDFLETFRNFFQLKHVHVLALVGATEYSRSLAVHREMMNFFKVVRRSSTLPEIDIVGLLQKEVLAIEKVQNVYVTYPVVSLIVKRFEHSSKPVEKALELLYSITTDSHRRKKEIIRLQDVKHIFDGE